MKNIDKPIKVSRHTVIEDIIVADSIKELNDKLAAYNLTDNATIRIHAEVFAINREDISPSETQTDDTSNL